MHVDEYSCDYAYKPSNPKLPHYTGAEDPGIWSMQVQACFLAHKTPTADQGTWMVTALRGTTMCYWFLECRSESSAPENIIAKLKDRFRQYSYECDLYDRLLDLRMTAQGYKSYADKFAELSAQLHKMELNALKHAFIKGLNAEFRQQVLLQGAKDLRGRLA